MEYTVQKLGQLAGISARTLRYYDEIEILKPARVSSSGYRIYGKLEVDKLQQILFYRELGLSLEAIRSIITSESFDGKAALKEHRVKLLQRREQLDTLIANVDQTIAQTEGKIKMTDKQKFEGFKENKIKDNEKKYGKEIREKYGEEIVKNSNHKMKNMTEQEYNEVTSIEKEVMEVLAEAFKTGDPASEMAQKAAELHKKWLTYYWSDYNKEAHAALSQMYVDDERFKVYYDKKQPGTAEFLRDAVHIYTGMKA